jgi:hypothetical protein
VEEFYDKNFTYCWLLRIDDPHPISEARLGGWVASRTIIEYGRASFVLKKRNAGGQLSRGDPRNAISAGFTWSSSRASAPENT